MFTTCKVHCCICQKDMDFMKNYGIQGCCCSRSCYQEFDWRRTLSILGKEYYPDPRPMKTDGGISDGSNQIHQ